LSLFRYRRTRERDNESGEETDVYSDPLKITSSPLTSTQREVSER
jgi:hypothetical protein